MVPTPPVLAYYSDALRDVVDVSAIWHISNTEYEVIALLRFLASACDDVVGVTCIDPRMGRNGLGELVP